MAQKSFKIRNKESETDNEEVLKEDFNKKLTLDETKSFKIREEDIKKYIIEAYNETLNQHSFYFYTKRKECLFYAKEDDCVTLTIYYTTENGRVLNKDFFKKQTSGEIANLPEGQNLGTIGNQMERRLGRINCEVKESVPSPNVSHPVFKLQAAQGSDPNYYVLILEDIVENTEFITLSKSENNEIIDDTIELESRSSYECKLYKVRKANQQFVVTRVTEPINLTTRNSKSDVRELMKKAEKFVQRKNVFDVKYLNREKPSYNKTDTGILKKYLKDANGDPYSSINENICGLHFSVNPVNSRGDLPNYSYFGDYRIKIVPEYLVEGCNLYFADFYCMGNPHWVTLVLTKSGSEEDKFCQNRLVKLDIKNNPFFWEDEDGYKVTFVFCEILYTEDINLMEMRLKDGFGEDYDIPLRGYGSSTGGIFKNPLCETCNLVPFDKIFIWQ